MKKIIVSAVSLLTVAAQGADDGLEFLKGVGFFDSVMVSSTNLTLKFKDSDRLFVREKQKDVPPYKTSRLPERGETISLIPDLETRLTDGRHVSFIFIPVEYRQKQRGFKIIDVFRWNEPKTNSITYIALSDTPVQVGEDDVEMILENWEWKPYKKPQSTPKEKNEVQKPPPSPEEPVTVTQDEPPANIAEDGQPSEEPSKASNRWLYALIPLCALVAILCFLRRKRK